MRVALLLLAALLPAAAAVAAPPLTAAQLEAVLAPIAQGRDPAFGPAVAPAQSLDPQLPPAARPMAAIGRIAQEAERVTGSFAAAAPAEQLARTRAAVAQFSPETAQDGASRSFEGRGPSLSVMRQLLFVPKAAAGADAVARVMQLVSQFEHSPKTDDTYYEYSDPADLKAASVTELPGSAASWTSAAQPPMVPGRVYALKKCRHILILGWYCNTSLYQVRDLPGSGGATKLLLTMLRPLPAGADNARFSDARAENIVDGYTAAYVVTAAGGEVLVYDLGIQSKAGAPSYESRLDEGQKEEYRQLVSRIEASLGITRLPFCRTRAASGRLQALRRHHRARRRRFQDSDEGRRCRGFEGVRRDRGREQSVMLQLGRQRANEFGSRHRQQLADLLHGEFGFARGDALADDAARLQPRLGRDLLGNAKLLQQRREIDAARAVGGVGDRSRREQRPLQRIGGGDIRPGRAGANGDADARARDLGPAGGDEPAVARQLVDGRRGEDGEVAAGAGLDIALQQRRRAVADRQAAAARTLEFGRERAQRGGHAVGAENVDDEPPFAARSLADASAAALCQASRWKRHAGAFDGRKGCLDEPSSPVPS